MQVCELLQKGKISLLHLLLVASCGLHSGFTLADVLYIDNVHGQDTGDGSHLRPWRSFDHALKQLSPGDDLRLISHGPSRPYRETLLPKISGTQQAPITIQADPSGSLAYVVATENRSDVSAGGSVNWQVTRDANWKLKPVHEVHGLWASSADDWDSSGVLALNERNRVDSESKLKSGTWFFHEKRRELLYRPKKNETLDATHIEMEVRTHNVNIHGLHHLRVKGVASYFASLSAAFGINGGSSNILLYGIVAKHAYNGISLGGGSSKMWIADCSISDVRNNGIILGGDPDSRLSNTIISGCEIKRVANNDCISLHKDKYDNDIGSGHWIVGNTLESCAEQGLDLVSGSDIIARNNVTRNNGASGITVGHGVEDVHIEGHDSQDDGEVAALIVGPSKNVTVKDSFFYNSRGRMLRVHKASNLSLENNTLVAGPDSRPNYIEFREGAHQVSYRRNIFTSVVDTDSPRYSYFSDMVPGFSDVSYEENIWWPARTKGGQFLVKDYGEFGFDDIRGIFGITFNDQVMDPGVRLLDLARRSLNLSGIPEGYGCNCGAFKMLD